MRAIFQSLPGLIDELPDGAAREAIVFAVWPTVLGEHLRERSTPLRLDNGTLTVAVSSSEWKREFKEHAAEIVFKLNRVFRKSLVERILPLVDSNAVELSKRKVRLDPPKVSTSLLSTNLKKASGKIADAELRTHFLEAAAACISRRDAR